jgi:hypothetical protein
MNDTGLPFGNDRAVSSIGVTEDALPPTRTFR